MQIIQNYVCHYIDITQCNCKS